MIIQIKWSDETAWKDFVVADPNVNIQTQMDNHLANFARSKKQYGLKYDMAIRVKPADCKEILDQIAHVLHDWPEGTRNAYVPDQLPRKVKRAVNKENELRLIIDTYFEETDALWKWNTQLKAQNDEMRASLRAIDDDLGPWMSAALGSDPCPEFAASINRFMDEVSKYRETRTPDV